MAKGQKRSGREPRKPKQVKAPQAATSPFGDPHKTGPSGASRKTASAR
ncbi:hypothetical protein [Fodinicurvata fenggangensis]|nr:hypothetical protein [Fodinicurvata fenggangensis]